MNNWDADSFFCFSLKKRVSKGYGSHSFRNFASEFIITFFETYE